VDEIVKFFTRSAVILLRPDPERHLASVWTNDEPLFRGDDASDKAFIIWALSFWLESVVDSLDNLVVFFKQKHVPIATARKLAFGAQPDVLSVSVVLAHFWGRLQRFKCTILHFPATPVLHANRDYLGVISGIEAGLSDFDVAKHHRS